jgi:uncharacterized damage-inducible protein DinB
MSLKDPCFEDCLGQLENLLDQVVLKIDHCLQQLNDDQIWWRPTSELPSIGNLILHICGNLRQWGADGLQGISNARDRDAEFALESRFTRAELLQLLVGVKTDVLLAIAGCPSENWLVRREIQGFQVTGNGALLHTLPHAVGHTHQIVMLTRLQKGNDYRFQWTVDGDRSVVPL